MNLKSISINNHQSKIINILIFIALTFCLPHYLSAQEKVSIRGIVVLCELNMHAPLVEIYVIDSAGDSIKIPTDIFGFFRLPELNKGTKCTVRFRYPYIKPKTVDYTANANTDTTRVVCLELVDIEKIKKDTTTILINHECGFLSYGNLTQNHGLKYGINWAFHGCDGDIEYDAHNKFNNMLLKIRNGEDWEDRFWKEIDVLRKSEKNKKKNKRASKNKETNTPYE